MPKTTSSSKPSNQNTTGFSCYFLISYLLMLFIVAQTIPWQTIFANGVAATSFMALTFLCYCVLYGLPASLITWLVFKISNFANRSATRLYPAYITAVLAGGTTTLLLYANTKIFSLYGTYINGFVINLVMTPGGIESLGGSNASNIGFVLIAIGFIALQALILWISINWQKKSFPSIIKKRYAISMFIVLLIGVHMTYAANEAISKSALTSQATSIPFFQTVSARHLFERLGFEIKRSDNIELKGHLNYPLIPLNIKTPSKPYNIIWLTSESWRADMLDKEIMPATWQFAVQANRYTKNYSGGNGTRMGVFTMFMGLPGNYWFSFINEQRGAAFIDVLQQEHYQMNLYTSAMFSYPEFEKTIFSKVPAEQLHSLQENGKFGWENDRVNVSSMLDFIDKRDPSKPFFSFIFFESPHARYHFPPESVIRRPYRDDINYATLSKEELRADIVPIKNRYINAVHHLDSQFDRVFTYLKDKNLLDSTIVILVGDHGEEFMEHGYWGHNSTFVDQQIRTPLVLWVPGQQQGKVVDSMTSHMDIVPTLMPLLGVTNSISDYSIGHNLLKDTSRNYTYVSDWDHITYIDKDIKITQPINIGSYAGNKVSDGNDEPLSEDAKNTLLKTKQPAMLQILQDLSHFLDKGKVKN
ncbi:MAG: sulfatase-like hydrolase/transferase [Methylophilaceae bacterium]|nr:sulfatase-like hydrolase/transferase [Methylophilaceae bacterium]